MRIPERFKIAGQTIEVEFDAKHMDRESMLGTAYYRYNKITLVPSIEEKHLDRQRIEEIFWHEAVHFILHQMGEHELKSNEKFVEMFSGFLHQVLTTMEYPVGPAKFAPPKEMI